MTALLKRWMALVAIGLMAGCGGGGGEGTAPFGGTGSGGGTGTGGGTTPPAALPTLTIVLSSTQITAANPSSTVTITVKDAAGQPAAARVVAVQSVRGLAALPTATVLTDANGIATTTFQAAAGGLGGADEISAAVTVGTTNLTGTAAFQVVATGSATGAPSLSVSLSSNTVSSASPATVTATVLDARGTPVAGRVVGFSSSRGLGSLSAATALTDAAGRAVVSLSPVNSTTAGADEVIASTTLAGASLTASQGFQLLATPVTITGLTATVGSGTLSAYGQTSLALTLTGASVGSPVNLELTSTCVTQGKAAISPSTFTTSTAVTNFQYTDGGCGALQGEDVITARIVGSTASPATLRFALASPAINSVAFVSASPSTIFLRGTGAAEASVVIFELRDSAGNPLPNQALELSLANSAGGVTLEGGAGPVTKRTDAQGRVSVIVNAGTVPTPVRVSALVVGTQIRTVSSSIGIGVGLPSQLNFSLSQQTRNIEGYNIDGTTNSYGIIASDRGGNAVPVGTSVNFVTESGQIEAVKQTTLVSGIARTSAGFVSASPRPVDGRFTVTAYAVGEESFLDLNGNNAYDSGEPFFDLGDVFRDNDFNGLFDPAIEEFVSLSPLLPNDGTRTTCSPPPALLLSQFSGESSVATVPGSCDGRWGRSYVRRSIETVLSTSSAEPVWIPGAVPGATRGSVSLRTSSGTATTTFELVDGTSISSSPQIGSAQFLVRDANPVRLNPVAAGSIVSASGSNGLSVRIASGSPVPSSTEATRATVEWTFADPPSPQSGTITITVTSPSGLATSFRIAVSR